MSAGPSPVSSASPALPAPSAATGRENRWRRRRSETPTTAAAIVTAVALLLLSCGSDDPAPTTPSPAAPPPTTPVPPPPPDPPPPPPDPDPPPPPGPLPTVGSPCPGITVGASQPEPVEGWLRASVEIGWTDSAGADGFHWATPYFDLYPDHYGPSQPPPALEVNLLGWNTETPAPDTIRHTLDLQWPPFLELALSFRSESGACGLPTLFCAESGCGLRP